ncbi:MAG: hypothetical protein JWL59_4598 [Chthoniobacteraceae bacterium]|nr:hypothetical protein [Chthoniobacteraceae bacterium]
MNKDVAEAGVRTSMNSQKSVGEIAFLNYCESRGLKVDDGEVLPSYEELKRSLPPSAMPALLGTALRRMLL